MRVGRVPFRELSSSKTNILGTTAGWATEHDNLRDASSVNTY